MADVSIKYKGTEKATLNASGTKTIKTSGKYCEADIVVEYSDPEKPTQSKTMTLGASAPSTVSPDSGKVLSSVSPSIDTSVIKAANIASGVQILGITGTHQGGITPSGNKAITAATSTQTGIDVTNYATVSVAPTPSESKTVTSNGTVTPSSGKLLSSVAVNVPTGTARSSSDLTASGLTVTAPAGLYSAAASKTLSDSNLASENIKKNVTIFGITGNYTDIGIDAKWYGYRSWSSASLAGNLALKNENWTNNEGTTGIVVGDVIMLETTNTDTGKVYAFLIKVTSMNGITAIGDAFAAIEIGNTVSPILPTTTYDGSVT